MKKLLLIALCALCVVSSCTNDNRLSAIESNAEKSPSIISSESRALWASINGRDDAVKQIFRTYNNKILVSWRMLPSDDEFTAFDLYRKSGNKAEIKVNSYPIVGLTNFQDVDADRSVDNTYRLCYAGSDKSIESYTITAAQAIAALPYVSIPLASTTDITPNWIYDANDASVGDLDGDGICEIVLKRLVRTTSSDAEDDNSIDKNISPKSIRHTTLLEAYKLDGTFMWRVSLGPNIPLGNSTCFSIYDFDGDGRCEVAFRTSEGTIFGNGVEIGDVDGDNKTDYRVDGSRYTHGGPEFLSVVEGATGKELARTDYIALGRSEDWGDDRYHRSSSYRLGAGNFSGKNTSILICRGCYNKIVVEAWDFVGGKLIKRWRFDTTDGIHGDYEAQGYHSLSVGDVDGDGFDEVVYGSCTIDHQGVGLNNCRLGHGDALHLGKFDQSLSGLQIWSCHETGSVGASLRDAKSGQVIWRHDDPSDVGRAMVADIDPDSPGCEMWWFRSNVHSCKGVDLGYTPSSCNMAIWWSGSLNRQLLNGTVIDQPNKAEGFNRVFTLNRYDVTSVNGSKENPCFYGDIVGDWREEIILVTNDNSELRLFSTWYPCPFKFPYLMSDHIYQMSAINQNICYNQPTQIGYYLGSDMLNDKNVINVYP